MATRVHSQPAPFKADFKWIRDLATRLWVTQVSMVAVMYGGKIPRGSLLSTEIKRLRVCITQYDLPCELRWPIGREPELTIYLPVSNDRVEPALRISAQHLDRSFHVRRLPHRTAEQIFREIVFSEHNLNLLDRFHLLRPRLSTYPPSRF